MITNYLYSVYRYVFPAFMLINHFPRLLLMFLVFRLIIVSYSRFADQADTEDAGILLLKGLDPAMPEIIRNFVAGNLDSCSTG